MAKEDFRPCLLLLASPWSKHRKSNKDVHKSLLWTSDFPTPWIVLSLGTFSISISNLFVIKLINKFIIELDLQSLFGLLYPYAKQYSLTETPQSPPPHLGSITRALVVSQDRRHLFVTLCINQRIPIGDRNKTYSEKQICLLGDDRENFKQKAVQKLSYFVNYSIHVLQYVLLYIKPAQQITFQTIII